LEVAGWAAAAAVAKMRRPVCGRQADPAWLPLARRLLVPSVQGTGARAEANSGGREMVSATPKPAWA